VLAALAEATTDRRGGVAAGQPEMVATTNGESHSDRVERGAPGIDRSNT
jgi:hypothetical protein